MAGVIFSTFSAGRAIRTRKDQIGARRVELDCTLCD